ncbi:MAG: murein L,D-transpeptidase catalytic domain family protein [Alphaproteobacteria bacterium]|nr:murein L,D-transpeptidase catalytic domain family protein [Alphaproteobacteria bacterium]MBU1525515.1 murein L,D-transpeptidase catalytic domain family protein [Alphaproteobacteria bacterium]MBU2117429.1 murein L,D-transpeptidase catalytic domain family protein [Alphaproteobacteria bacterium]MBU2350917.1 murein L,D-transpeptidase catalytic domain family protein [Alphaproteobacteria bacterium]MBU2383084.1 murein L,D-transpeptidase catalytic domain family protein [Alphaproteobacteria bacterium
MRVSRRGVILGGSALLAGCSSAASSVQPVAPLAAVVETPIVPAPAIAVAAADPFVSPPLDPRGLVRKELMDRAMAALDIHHARIPNRDRMYLVDFKRHSGEERLYEVDLHAGTVKTLRTSHGRGSDPDHVGFARNFSNVPESYCSSVGSYVTAGPSWGPAQGPNVLLDGLEYSNDKARDRAIIVHGADYADPDFLAREGKLGRSYGCFSVAHADLPDLRERMGQGRLLFAFA